MTRFLRCGLGSRGIDGIADRDCAKRLRIACPLRGGRRRRRLRSIRCLLLSRWKGGMPDVMAVGWIFVFVCGVIYPEVHVIWHLGYFFSNLVSVYSNLWKCCAGPLGPRMIVQWKYQSQSQGAAIPLVNCYTLLLISATWIYLNAIRHLTTAPARLSTVHTPPDSVTNLPTPLPSASPRNCGTLPASNATSLPPVVVNPT